MILVAWESRLASMPETGPGYLLIDVRLRNGETHSGMVVIDGESEHHLIGYVGDDREEEPLLDRRIDFVEADIDEISVLTREEAKERYLW